MSDRKHPSPSAQRCLSVLPARGGSSLAAQQQLRSTVQALGWAGKCSQAPLRLFILVSFLKQWGLYLPLMCRRSCVAMSAISSCPLRLLELIWSRFVGRQDTSVSVAVMLQGSAGGGGERPPPREMAPASAGTLQTVHVGHGLMTALVMGAVSDRAHSSADMG